MQHIHALVNQLSSLPPEIWQAALVGLIASTKLEVLKKFVGLHKTQVKILLGLVYLVGSLAVYTINQDPLLQNWVASIASQMGISALTSSSFYLVFVRGLYGTIIAPNFGSAKELNDMLKSSVVPAEGLPLEAQGKVSNATYQDPISESDFGS